jgi:hypothetical protein
MIRTNKLILLAAFTLYGCGSIVVKQAGPNGAVDMPGIPFYSKSAQYTHETKWLRRELVVSVIVTERAGSETTRVAHYPVTGGLVLPATAAQAVETWLGKLLGEAKDTWQFAEATAAAEKTVRDLQMLRDARAHDELLSNTIGYAMVIGPERLYINTLQPLIGTANSTYKLSGDGTLTEATTNVTDDTLKTILGLFPINAKLSQAWGLTKPAATPIDGGRVPTAVEIDSSVVSKDTVITLRRLPPDDHKPGPLQITDGVAGTNNVQLVSTEVVSGAGKEESKSSKKDDASSYKIQGTITPPRPLKQ